MSCVYICLDFVSLNIIFLDFTLFFFFNTDTIRKIIWVWENSFGKLCPQGVFSLSFQSPGSNWQRVGILVSFSYLSSPANKEPWYLRAEIRNWEITSFKVSKAQIEFYFWDGVFWSLGRTCTSYVPEDDPKLLILLRPPPDCLDSSPAACHEQFMQYWESNPGLHACQRNDLRLSSISTLPGRSFVLPNKCPLSICSTVSFLGLLWGAQWT